MRGRKRRSFDFGNFEITKREILVSVSIVAIMLLIGVLIAGKISDYQLDKNEKYNKAIKIESQELFEYGMRTNAGNAFVYGDLKAVDTVTYPGIGGEYIVALVGAVNAADDAHGEHRRKHEAQLHDEAAPACDGGH